MEAVEKNQANFQTKQADTITESITQQNVLIVGGGHVGLSFALLLAHHGIASTLLEKNRYPQISPDDDSHREQYLDCRNTALSRRTVQIYQQIGLWQDLQSHACRIDSVQISEQGSFGSAQLKREEEGVESFGQVMENAWLGRKLLLAVQASPLITLIDGATVTAITQNPSQKEVTLTYTQADKQTDTQNNHSDSQAQQLTASMLVACDGRDSLCRQLLGIGTDDYDYQQTGIVGVVQTDKPHEHIAIERFSPAGPLAVLPLTDRGGDGNLPTQAGYRRSVVWVCPKGEEQRYLDDDEYFLQTLQKAFGQRAGRFMATGKRGAYPLTRVLAKSQVQGRCVIMGNSAHTLHPVAGQGFNLCMRDADVLAKMLARQVMQGEDIGDSRMLARYEQARKKDQKRVIRFCDAVVHGFTNPNPAVKIARNLALIAFDKLPNVKPLVASYAMGLKS
ncbi:UbiH/UbiF/VisC/COQ6 family ubiquinone biosynthesis hydroxylase [Psychrobacter sp. I-STPA6b]|uniref:UbiH/UbiF/VisC/COQ6 family ubiquinone biosynthesis hydroxylase n=1 Tax=Psychrobacter sp. I-STPA6b TaxID=2585718 RepID=UPI001D0C9AC6|nr:UbiH/UbiF/VisC/COQ6 family ubiquinone biosynthesis hydroxylase [Psychrobacter sp. I-STPA6b]